MVTAWESYANALKNSPHSNHCLDSSISFQGGGVWFRIFFLNFFFSLLAVSMVYKVTK